MESQKKLSAILNIIRRQEEDQKVIILICSVVIIKVNGDVGNTSFSRVVVAEGRVKKDCQAMLKPIYGDDEFIET